MLVENFPIDKILVVDSTFGARIESKRIGAAGFSLGGYTMIEIAIVATIKLRARPTTNQSQPRP